MRMSRRSALKMGISSLAYFTTQMTTPNWIIRSADALPATCIHPDRILVILQHAGGIDGLNTVIPVEDANYYNARPTLSVAKVDALQIDPPGDLLRFHPRLSRLAEWFLDGSLAVLNNVGYQNPNLSHFVSTDFFEYGKAPGETLGTQGWISRFFDNACGGLGEADPLTMIASGLTAVPGMLAGSTLYVPPAVSNSSSYALLGPFNSVEKQARFTAIDALNSISAADPDLDFVQRSQNLAVASVQDVATAALEPILAPEGYPSSQLGRGLQLASQVIRAGFSTKIIYVSQGGYDTHGNQVSAVPANRLTEGAHPELLEEFDWALNSFLTEMLMSGNFQRVAVMTFSEFGRRVAENDSFGTDHGAANAMFVAGGLVLGGFYGGQPDLVPGNLVKGNLNYTIDFRSVYSRIIESWFGGDAASVFGQPVYDSIVAPDLPGIPFIIPLSQATRWTRYR